MTIREAWLVYLGVLSEGCKLSAEGSKLYAECSKLCTEGSTLHAEGSRLLDAEGRTLHAEGSKLYAECSKLYAECSKLCAEGRMAFLDVVISQLGNVEIKWIYSWDSIEIDGTTYTKNLNDSWNKKDSCDGTIVEIEGKKYQLKEVINDYKGYDY